MSLNSSPLMDQIHDLISNIFKNTAEKNRMNLSDQANYLEDLFGNIFNELYGCQVININQGKANQQAVDLIDERKKILVQVTTLQSGFALKKTKTIKGFLEQTDYNSFKKLYLLLLTDKIVPSKVLEKASIRKGCDYEGVDKNKLLNKIKSARVPIKEKVLQLLKEEMIKREPVQPGSSLDLEHLKTSLCADLKKFLSIKYFSNTYKSIMPVLLGRQVKRYNQEIKVSVKDLQLSAREQIKKEEVIIGDLSSMMLSEKPTFLFGEMGSGKSTMAAELLFRRNQNGEGINILIPANHIKGKISGETTSLLHLLANYLNEHLLISCDQQQISVLLQFQLITIGFDGIDELALTEARNLVTHLVKLSDSFPKLSILATGRPIELSSIVHRQDWNCLSTIDLSLQEMTQLLINESLAEGQNIQQATADAGKRITYIKTRTDLLSLAVTPLILTMIRDYLDEQSDALTLGDILYKVIKAKLDWEGKDPKKHQKNFYEAYPSVFHREKFAAVLSSAIHNSPDKSITEELLYLVCSRVIVDSSPKGNQLCSEVVEYLKGTFLQKTNDNYSFISQPLLDTAYGIYLSGHLFDTVPTYAFCAENWRAISIAASVIRARGESASYREQFCSLLENYLVKESETTQSAVIVQEFRDASLAEKFIELLCPLKFRPLQTWKDEDSNMQAANSFAPIALANAIYLAGIKGYDWLYTEYLDLRHPLNSHQTGLSANLLLYYLVRANFTLDQQRIDQLRKFVRYVCYYRSFAITDILPVITLVIPEELQPGLRARLLLVMRTKDAASERAQKLIDQMVGTDGTAALLDAIEVYAQESEGRPNPEILKLWYQHQPGNLMNDAVFKASISAIVGGDTQLMELLIQRTGRDQLFEYLKLICLIEGARCDESAILLHDYFGLRDFHLVARPIMLLSKWSHGKDAQRKNILNQILFEGDHPTAVLVRDIDYSKQKEIPLLAFEYLIRSLLFLDGEHPGYLRHAVQMLPKYCLTRNPELRDAISRLLSQKPVYFQTLREAALALDMNLRRHARQVLIACMPSNCGSELLSMVRGSLDRLPSGDEWIAFINKLDFSMEVLDQLYQALNDLNPWAKTHAMILLYRNKYTLSEVQIEEFAKLLMGKGQHYDATERGESQQRILEDPVFLPMLIQVMKADELYDFESVSSVVYHHHKERVSEEDFLYASVIQVQQHGYYLFQFAADFSGRFSDPDFLALLEKVSTTVKKVTSREKIVAQTLLKAFQGSHQHWVNLLESIFFKKERFEEMAYHGIYTWLMHLRKHRPDLSWAAGKAALKIANTSVETQHLGDKSVKGVFLLLAHEFYQAEINDLANVVRGQRIDRELFPALASRTAEPVPGPEAEPFRHSYYSFFKDNHSSTIRPISKGESDRYLGTDIGIPEGFGNFLRSVVFYRSLSATELEQTELKAPGKVLQVILQFVSGSTVDFKPLLEMMAQTEQREMFAQFKGIFILLKEIRLQQPGGRESYVLELKNRIRINRRHFLAELEMYFIELFEMKVPLESDLFEILIEEIIARFYVLQMDLLYLISEHIADGISATQHEKIADLTYTYLSAILDFSDDAHQEDYYQIQWLFALIQLYIRQKTDTRITNSFLLGLQTLFIQDSRLADRNREGHLTQFKGRDLIHHTAILFEKIPQNLVGEILNLGLSIAVPQIRVVCMLLKNFHPAQEK